MYDYFKNIKKIYFKTYFLTNKINKILKHEKQLQSLKQSNTVHATRGVHGTGWLDCRHFYIPTQLNRFKIF